MDEIEQETKLAIELEEVYSWMAFVSSRQNPNICVANRFFGLQPDGEYKVRGLACRREDTPFFVAETQLLVFQILAQQKDPNQLEALFPEVLNMLRDKMSALGNKTIPLKHLLVTQTLSRDLDEYRVPSPVARAGGQLQSIGKQVQMGQKIQFIYTKTKEGVCAWDLNELLPPTWVDTAKYKELLFRAVYEVLEPLGVTERVLRNWL
jgi:DNA polymerase I